MSQQIRDSGLCSQIRQLSQRKVCPARLLLTRQNAPAREDWLCATLIVYFIYHSSEVFNQEPFEITIAFS